VAEKYGLDMRVNPNGGTSAKDWNFAYAQAKTDYVTLAHQDDIYEPSFTEKTLDALESAKNPIIAYTDYYELRYSAKDEEGNRVDENKLLSVKRKMLRLMDLAPSNKWLRNRVLSFGYPINCPGSTYVKKRFESLDFLPNWHNSHDWELVIRLAANKGEFVYIRDLLLGHRIYLESQTTNTIGSGIRYQEDLTCLKKYWPTPIAKLIMKPYSKSYESNRL